MAINKVDVYVSQITQDLSNGLTWLKKDDLGYGSIEEKYNANSIQIATIRKHPKLKDAETSITVFNVIDDTNETTNKTSESKSSRTSNTMEQSMVPVDGNGSKMVEIKQSENTTEDISAFINL